MKMIYENVHQQYMIYENTHLKNMIMKMGLWKCPLKYMIYENVQL